jgi:hypothetical protein
MTTLQQQSSPPDGADSDRELCSAPWYLISWGSNADLPLTKPGCRSTSIFDRFARYPNLGGAGPSGQPYEWTDMSYFYPSCQSAASMTGLLAYRSQVFALCSTSTSLMNKWLNPLTLTHTSAQFNAGSRVPTNNHSLNNFGTSPLFNSAGYTDPASPKGLGQQEHVSRAAGNKHLELRKCRSPGNLVNYGLTPLIP